MKSGDWISVQLAKGTICSLNLSHQVCSEIDDYCTSVQTFSELLYLDYHAFSSSETAVEGTPQTPRPTGLITLASLWRREGVVLKCLLSLISIGGSSFQNRRRRGTLPEEYICIYTHIYIYVLIFPNTCSRLYKYVFMCMYINVFPSATPNMQGQDT